MTQRKQRLTNMSVCVPQTQRDQKPMELLIELSKTKDRSVCYLVVEAILEFLERRENTQ